MWAAGTVHHAGLAIISTPEPIHHHHVDSETALVGLVVPGDGDH
jgi:hypothetical protein